jgi:hypothetical protein
MIPRRKLIDVAKELGHQEWPVERYPRLGKYREL